jgi:hypothetical protein
MRELVREFIRYRRQDIKKPFKTDRGVKTFYNQLVRLSNNNLVKASELVKHAKDNEWQTVYPIKKEKYDGHTNKPAVKQHTTMEEFEKKDYSVPFGT